MWLRWWHISEIVQNDKKSCFHVFHGQTFLLCFPWPPMLFSPQIQGLSYTWRIQKPGFPIISYFPYKWMNVNLGSHCSSSQYPSGSDACGSSPVRPYLPVMEETGFDGARPFRYVPRFIVCAVSGALTGFVAVGSLLWMFCLAWIEL